MLVPRMVCSGNLLLDACRDLIPYFFCKHPRIRP
jgi:hypothetical protein